MVTWPLPARLPCVWLTLAAPGAVKEEPPPPEPAGLTRYTSLHPILENGRRW